MLLFCEEYRMFGEIIHKEGKIQLNINGIRQLIRLLVSVGLIRKTFTTLQQIQYLLIGFIHHCSI